MNATVFSVVNGLAMRAHVYKDPDSFLRVIPQNRWESQHPRGVLCGVRFPAGQRPVVAATRRVELFPGAHRQRRCRRLIRPHGLVQFLQRGRPGSPHRRTAPDGRRLPHAGPDAGRDHRGIGLAQPFRQRSQADWPHDRGEQPRRYSGGRGSRPDFELGDPREDVAALHGNGVFRTRQRILQAGRRAVAFARRAPGARLLAAGQRRRS